MADTSQHARSAATERHGREWNAERCACGAALVGCHGCFELRCLTCDPYTDYERLNRCCTAPPSETRFDSDWLGKPTLTEKHYSAASPSGLIGSLWLVLKGRRLHA